MLAVYLTVDFLASSVGAVCRESQVVSQATANTPPTKELHGTHLINGNHQQRSGRRAVSNYSREASADPDSGCRTPHKAESGFGRAATLEDRQ